MEKKTIWDLNRDSLAEFKAKPKMPLAVVLDNVRSLNNIGSIFRTCDAFAVDRICLCGITAAPPSPEIHKTALGAEDSVDWKHYESTLEAVEELRDNGFTVCCLEQVKGSIPLQKFEVEKGRKYAIIAGHEVNGVDPVVVNACDLCIEIPQMGTKHSMNVSVSTGITLWHLFSQML